MKNVKKIILYLAGIFLLAFGNKTAIHSIFANDKHAENEKSEKQKESQTQNFTTNKTEIKSPDNNKEESEPGKERTIHKKKSAYVKKHKKDKKAPNVDKKTKVEPAKAEESTPTK